jgi:hypothetical protein
MTNNLNTLPRSNMSDDAPAPEIQINIKGTVFTFNICQYSQFKPGPSELKLQISIATDKSVLDLKKAIAEKSEVEADRQRLIYSGTFSISCFIRFLTCTRTCIEGMQTVRQYVITNEPFSSRTRMCYQCTKSNLHIQYTWLRASLALQQRPQRLSSFLQCKQGRTLPTRSLSSTATKDSVRWLA